MNDRSDVAQRVADHFGREECVLVGRGTTGLALLFEELVDRGTVLLPGYACPVVVFAAHLADVDYGFVDVRARDFNLDPAAVEDVVDDGDVVVPIHMFGHPAPMPRLSKCAREAGAAVVEDTCHSAGSRIDGRTVGSFGDASVVSFGEKKPIDAGGGGAVLTDRSGLARRMRERAARLPVPDPDRLESLAGHYRELYYDVRDLCVTASGGKSLVAAFPAAFRESLLRGFDDRLVRPLDAALDGIESTFDTRRRHADLYRERIDAPSLRHPDPESDCVPYRYTVIAATPEQREYVVDELRSLDFHVSTLYPPATDWFETGTADLETADALARRAFNLWVAERVDRSYGERCASAVDDLAREWSEARADRRHDGD